MVIQINKLLIKLYFLLFFAISPLSCNEEGCFYVMKDLYPNTGMFATVQGVLGFLHMYETKGSGWSGLEVNLGTEGVYWTAAKGNNWWEYYFQPIRISKTQPNKTVHLDFFGLDKLGIHGVSRERGHYLIKKYIKIKEEIQDKADIFYKKNLQNSYVIGIHYRGTDKIIEAPRVSYEAVWIKILEVIDKLRLGRIKNMKIFVATDEEQFISFIRSKFNDVYSTEATRAADSLAVHIFHNQDPYKNGEEALIDCLLLSRCQVLIRTESHLSTTALMLNLDIIPYTLNKCY